jgi:rSAM/selenodomain-associated transferase 2
MIQHRLSVVIPALNEQENIGQAIESARRFGSNEIIVVDGGSSDKTVDLATQAGAIVKTTEPGRAKQMNHGAAVCSGTVVLFLHADNQLPAGGRQFLDRALDAGAKWGCLRQRIDSSRRIYRMIERGNTLRARILGRVFGDQALWVTRTAFENAGSFPDWPLMEDVALSKRLRSVSRPAILKQAVTVSPRRWEQNGMIRQTLRNWSLQIRYLLGTRPEKLARLYRPNKE